MISKLEKITDYIWQLPLSYKKGMRVPVRIIGSEKIIRTMEEVVFAQAVNVAKLPGLVGFVVLLPDAHSGYGAPIGTVFATDPKADGVISPGAVGYDINCGMRLLATNLTIDEVVPRLAKLVNLLFDLVPAGVGREGFLPVTYNELDKIAVAGASFMVKNGFGWEDDLVHIEEKGSIAGGNPDKVSQRAKERGKQQLATLGSGNHYLEIQKVVEIFDQSKAYDFGIMAKDQVVVMFHCGSRGLGHQIASDYLHIFTQKLAKYQIAVDDLQLACAPFDSPDGQSYYQAFVCAANFAFANRQAITYKIREAFAKIFKRGAESLGMNLIYDVAHNIAKIERHITDNRQQITNKLVVHRKGATRSFPGQPVIIGGSMETGSYLLSGTKTALSISFGSTAHGSGRIMSRHQAKQKIRGEEL